MHRRREYEGWPIFCAWRWATGGLVLGLVVLMLGIGWHLLSVPPPSAEEQRLAVRQQQVDVQAHQQAVERERAAAAADDRVDAGWRPWRMAALNLMLISLALAPVVGLMAGGALVWARMRPARRAGRSRVRAVLASVRGWRPWRRAGLRRPARPVSTWPGMAPSEPPEGDAG